MIWASKSWIKKERERNWKEKVIEKEGEIERETRLIFSSRMLQQNFFL